MNRAIMKDGSEIEITSYNISIDCDGKEEVNFKLCNGDSYIFTYLTEYPPNEPSYKFFPAHIEYPQFLKYRIEYNTYLADNDINYILIDLNEEK